MSEVLKERSEMDREYQWDLSSLYKSDADWEQDLLTLDKEVEALCSYKGKLKDAETIYSFYRDSTAFERHFDNLISYAFLRQTQDMRADDAKSMSARAESKGVQAQTLLSFARPEILALPEKTLEAITRDPKVKDYRFLLEDLLREKPHTLSAEGEQLLAGFGEVLSAPQDIANNLQDADLVFDSVTDGAGKETEVTGLNYILLQSSTDRTLREHSFRSYYKTYRQHINTFASAYAGAVKACVAEARARKYASSREMMMADENVPGEVYDSLIDTVRRHMPSMHRYAALRKKILKLSELHYYDLYAPLSPDAQEHYTYDQAKEMVLSALSPLGEDYLSVVRRGFESHWIDVYPNKGKRGGAFSSGTYDSNPYILCNFTGTLDHVSTIAHEMGYSMHSYLANHAQPPQYANYKIFVAEVASTVNENLLVEDLLRKTKDPLKRLALLNQYLEGFKGTVYRQTMFAEFERDAHAMYEKGEALNPTSLNGLYEGLIRDYFGDALMMDREVELEWARIPHFYRPFYVYKYATGYSAAVALSEGILNGDPTRVKRYLEFLQMGGSTYPLEELQHAGVDLTRPEPIDTALQKFDRVLDEAEEIATRF